MPSRNAPTLPGGAIFSGAAFGRFGTRFLSKGDLILLAWQPFVLREEKASSHSFLMEEGFAVAIGSRRRYRARFFRRSFVSSPPFNVRAARDAGDLPIPTVSCRKEKRHESCSHHGFRVFPERPAHGVSRLAPHEPRWTYLAFPFADRPFSIHRWTGSHTGCAVFGIRTPQTRRPQLWRAVSAPGTVRLGPPDLGCEPSHGHRSRSAFQDASRNAPRGSRRYGI